MNNLALVALIMSAGNLIATVLLCHMIARLRGAIVARQNLKVNLVADQALVDEMNRAYAMEFCAPDSEIAKKIH